MYINPVNRNSSYLIDIKLQICLKVGRQKYNFIESSISRKPISLAAAVLIELNYQKYPGIKSETELIFSECM